MRIFSVCLAILLLFTTTVQATYESVENGRTMYDRLGEDRALHLVKEFSPVEKIVTKDQFLNRKLSRGERREIRQEKKLGVYKTPEEEFELMDLNKDGKLDYEEMKEYYTRKAYRRYSR